MFQIILIARMLAAMPLTKEQREEITACTLYGVKKEHKEKLMKRYENCKITILKKSPLPSLVGKTSVQWKTVIGLSK